ncbi:MAG TPA: hydroxymethylglutaryl-CoA synthase [Microbacteriaceae bacterium]|nr:hydroxymethylglutaryl-CoA synthase [Microbacteriaceae bacterium]
MKIGIHDIAAATGSLVLDLSELAEHKSVDLAKFQKGLGQYEMSVTSSDEDIVTLAATAAKQIIDRHGADNIRTILFATESGVDQSKAAGVFMHGLLGLPGNCRIVELKEACYSATAALQFAAGIIARKPHERVLVIASDTARYELDSGGEPTQGSGAIAMLVSKDPAIYEFEDASGLWSADVMDFWRPNDRSTALVDGHYSMQVYLDSLEHAWEDFLQNGGANFEDIHTICYHQPFTKMAIKAHTKLAEICEIENVEDTLTSLEPTLIYNRRLGNSYTASVFFAFLSLLDNSDDLTDERIALFSYGSGAVAEIFTGLVVQGYEKHLRKEENQKMLDSRKHIKYEEYRKRHIDFDRVGDFVNAEETPGKYRYAGVFNSERTYRKK